MSIMYDKTPDDFDWSFTTKPALPSKTPAKFDDKEWMPSLTEYRQQYAKERRVLERTRYSAILPQTLEDSWDEIIKLKKRVEQLEKQVSDYGWERDTRNGNIQGMW